MNDVCIVCMAADNKFAEELSRILKRNRFSVSITTLLPGSAAYPHITQKQLNNNCRIVVLWSEGALQSGTLQRALESEAEKGNLLSVSTDSCSVPIPYHHLPQVNLSSWDGQEETADLLYLFQRIKSPFPEIKSNRISAGKRGPFHITISRSSKFRRLNPQRIFSEKAQQRRKRLIAFLQSGHDEETALSDRELISRTVEFENHFAQSGIPARIIHIRLSSFYVVYTFVFNTSAVLSSLSNALNAVYGDYQMAGVRAVRAGKSKTKVRIEVPNLQVAHPALKDLLLSQTFLKSKKTLPVVLGVDVKGKVVTIDLNALPHLFIAGGSERGSSSIIQSIVVSLLFMKNPGSVKFAMIDSGQKELALFQELGSRYFARPENLYESIVSDAGHISVMLQSLIKEMEKRFAIHSAEDKGSAKNMLNRAKLPHIVVIIADLQHIMKSALRDAEININRLAQIGHLVGIHLIVATNSVAPDIFTGVFRANFPVRLCFKLSSYVESRTVLETRDACFLASYGDAFFLADRNSHTFRIKTVITRSMEIKNFIHHINGQSTNTEYLLPDALPS